MIVGRHKSLWHPFNMAPCDAKKCTWGASQKHFRCTIVGPDSSYSPLEIHICWKVLKEERMEPPIHTEYLRSGGATTLIFMVEGANASKHGSAAREHNVAVEVLSNVDITLHDGLEG